MTQTATNIGSDSEVRFYVDIPSSDNIDDAWINVESFLTKEEAIKFAQVHFETDEDGKISLIFQS